VISVAITTLESTAEGIVVAVINEVGGAPPANTVNGSTTPVLPHCKLGIVSL
jgi:hypothetical protein